LVAIAVSFEALKISAVALGLRGGRRVRAVIADVELRFGFAVAG
jgi:hypothetical protein